MIRRGCALMCLLLWSSAAAAETKNFPTLWGKTTKEPATNDLLPAVVTSWRGVLQRFAAEEKEFPLPLHVFLEAIRTFTPREQLNAVQRLVVLYYQNYQPDIATYGRSEYWATPGEVYKNGGSGDCEDFAIISYVLLRKLGWGGNVAIVTVYTEKEESHAALVAYMSGEIFLIDGRFKRNKAIPVDQAAYQSFYGMNESGWWSYVDP